MFLLLLMKILMLMSFLLLVQYAGVQANLYSVSDIQIGANDYVDPPK